MHIAHGSIGRGLRAQWRIALLLILIAAPALAAEPNYPQLTGRVVDQAGILSPATTAELTEMSARYEKATGSQVVVVTLASLQGYSIEDFGYQLGRHWGIGQKDKNTGALLIVAPKEHKVRIEVGYGLEGKLTDAISRTIIEREILPSFRRGDFNAGVIAGAASILNVLGGDTAAGAPGVQSKVYQNQNPIHLTLSDALFPLVPLISLLLFIALFLYIASLSRNPYLVRRSRYGSGGFGSWGGGSSGGGGSSSGGGFSGGGGSFGGGGASGGW